MEDKTWHGIHDNDIHLYDGCIYMFLSVSFQRKTSLTFFMPFTFIYAIYSTYHLCYYCYKFLSVSKEQNKLWKIPFPLSLPLSWTFFSVNSWNSQTTILNQTPPIKRILVSNSLQETTEIPRHKTLGEIIHLFQGMHVLGK